MTTLNLVPAPAAPERAVVRPGDRPAGRSSQRENGGEQFADVLRRQDAGTDRAGAQSRGPAAGAGEPAADDSAPVVAVEPRPFPGVPSQVAAVPVGVEVPTEPVAADASGEETATGSEATVPVRTVPVSAAPDTAAPAAAAAVATVPAALTAVAAEVTTTQAPTDSAVNASADAGVPVAPTAPGQTATDAVAGALTPGRPAPEQVSSQVTTPSGGIAAEVAAGTTAVPSSADGAEPAGASPAGSTASQPGATQSAQPALAVSAQTTALSTPAAAPAAAPTGTSAPPLHEQVVPRLASVKDLGDGVHRLTLRVQPESIGAVRVVAEVRGDSVRLELHGGTEAAREALRAVLPEIRRDLAAVGLTGAQLDLGTASDGRHGPFAGHGTGRGSGQPTSPGGSAAAAPPAPPPPRAADGRLDVLA